MFNFKLKKNVKISKFVIKCKVYKRKVNVNKYN